MLVKINSHLLDHVSHEKIDIKYFTIGSFAKDYFSKKGKTNLINVSPCEIQNFRHFIKVFCPENEIDGD